MAWRNIWRHRRRTLVTVFGISFGTMLAILFTGLGDANWTKMIDHAVRLGSGHVTIQHPEYLDKPSTRRTVGQTGVVVEKIKQYPNVKRVVTRISGQAMLATAAQYRGAFFIAFDPAVESLETLAVFGNVVQGKMFATKEETGIILGERLSENLEAKLGRKVVYTLNDKQGEIVSGLARVSGIIRTGAPSVDGGLFLLTIDTIRDVLGYAADEATQIAVFIRDQRDTEMVTAGLGKLVGSQVGVFGWQQVQPDLAGFIAMKISGTVFFEVLIMVLIAAGIFNTLFVSVMERMREFGIMAAIGFSPLKLFSLIMWESLWIALTGLVTTVIITAWPYHYISTKGIDFSAMTGGQSTEIAGVAFDPIMYVDIFPINVVIIGIVVLVATLVSGLYPAWRAGRVVPVESIKLV